MPAALRWARRVLWAEIALTVLAVATVLAAPFLAGLMVSHSGPTVVMGFALATPLLGFGPLLLATGVTGLMAVRRERWRRGAGFALITPLALLVVSTVGAPLAADPQAEATVRSGAALPDAYLDTTELTLQVLTAAHAVALVAFCLAAAAGALLLHTTATSR